MLVIRPSAKETFFIPDNLVTCAVVVKILAKEIEVRQMQEDAEEQLRAARRRISSLEHSVKMVREENQVGGARRDSTVGAQDRQLSCGVIITCFRGQVKLRELETSVRVLSGRGDVHRALACLRQELAGERVTIVYLRGAHYLISTHTCSTRLVGRLGLVP